MPTYAEFDVPIPQALLQAPAATRRACVSELLRAAKTLGYSLVFLSTTYDAALGLVDPPPPPLSAEEIGCLERESGGVIVLQRLNVRVAHTDGFRALATTSAKQYALRCVELTEPTLLDDSAIDLSKPETSFDVLNVSACCSGRFPAVAFVLPRRRLPSKVVLELSYSTWMTAPDERNLTAAIHGISSAVRTAAGVFSNFPILFGCGPAAARDLALRATRHQHAGACPTSVIEETQSAPRCSYTCLRAPLDVMSLGEALTGRHGLVQLHLRFVDAILRRASSQKRSFLASRKPLRPRKALKPTLGVKRKRT